MMETIKELFLVIMITMGIIVILYGSFIIRHGYKRNKK
jgi:hypothetical protein